MVLCLVSHLKRKGRDREVFVISDEVFNTTQISLMSAYKMRFCIYLMYHKLDEYIQLTLRNGIGSKEYEIAQMDLFYNDSPYVEKTITDEAYYLLADGMANLKKIAKNEKTIYSYIVFFSKYVNPSSESAKIIVRYLNDNKEKIDDANILMFLKKVGDQKALLKELVIANIDNEKNEMMAAVAQIVVSDFETDDEIKQLLTLDDWERCDNSWNRLSLNCLLNKNTDKLKDIYRENRKDGYLLSSSYALCIFIMTLADVKDIVKNLEYYLTETLDTFAYRLMVMPLTERLKRDKALADKIYEELLKTESPRKRVGFYSLLSFAGVKSSDLRDWRNRQYEHLEEYGFDIMLNRDRRLIVILQ